jgi:predicted PurR-regulated permease PerM
MACMICSLLRLFVKKGGLSMSSNLRSRLVVSDQHVGQKWARRRDIPIAILAWIALVMLILWGAGHIIRALLLLLIAALLAYVLAPLVKIFQKVMPRFIAILLVYLVVLGVISLLLYFITVTAIHQFDTLARHVRELIDQKGNTWIASIESLLHSSGIPQAQINSARDQILSSVSSFVSSKASNVVPFLSGFVDFLLDIVLVAIMSIYFLMDGSRITGWLRNNLPHTTRINFILDTIQRVVGGYIRGQLSLAVLIGLLVGVGMALFHVPYALLLGVLAFVMAFIPILGTLISGAICALLALTQGWLIALGVLVYFIAVHIIESDIVGPRIVGDAIGLHPIVSMAALIAGSELFGVWGTLFASPIAGVLQALLVALWIEWRATHPEQFEQKKTEVIEQVDEDLKDKSISSE